MAQYTATLGPGHPVNKSVIQYQVYDGSGLRIGMVLVSLFETPQRCELSLNWIDLDDRRLSHILGVIRQLLCLYPQATVFTAVRPTTFKVDRRIPIAAVNRHERQV